MKYTLRVPTAHQYAYIECEYDGEAEGAVEHYQKLTDMVKVGPGLPDKEFAKVLDEYVKTKKVVNGHEAYEQMNAVQQGIVQAVKKSFKRMQSNI